MGSQWRTETAKQLWHCLKWARTPAPRGRGTAKLEAAEASETKHYINKSNSEKHSDKRFLPQHLINKKLIFWLVMFSKWVCSCLFSRYTQHKPRQTKTFFIWFKAINFSTALGKEPFFIFLLELLKREKVIVCLALWMWQALEWEGAGADPWSSGVPTSWRFTWAAQGKKKQLHAVHIRRTNTNYIRYFQNTKKETREQTKLVNSPRQCDNPSSEVWDSTQSKLLSLLSVSASSDSSARPQKVRAVCLSLRIQPKIINFS